MFDQEDRADPDLLSRWIAVLALLRSARELLGRGGGAWPRLGLVSADTAVEAILGLIASGGTEQPSDRVEFDRLVALARDALKEVDADIPPGLRSRITAGHRLRNMALHHGSEPATSAVARVIAAAEELRRLAVERAPTLRVLRGSGPVSAVAHEVAIPDIGEQLERAETHLSAGDYANAVDAAAIAFEVALQRTRPSLRPKFSRFLRAGFAPSYAHSRSPEMAAIKELARHIDGVVEHTDERHELVEAWVLALGLGLSPLELARLRRTLGSVVRYGDGSIKVRRDPRVLLDAATVEGAVLSVADVVFRLWAGGTLRAGDVWSLRDELDDDDAEEG